MSDLAVNGEPVDIASDKETPLLDVLRDELGLLGSRFGCGQSLCGACMVDVDGTAMPSCQTPLWQVIGKQITTVEGLCVDGRAHPVQRAIIEHQAAQCGFCVSGIVVAAVALLKKEPEADIARVAEELDRNLCRCGAQRRILEAVVSVKDSR